jgi:hypothetical protein
MCALGVYVNREARILFHQGSSGTGVIEVDMRKENRIEVGDGQPVLLELLA